MVGTFAPFCWITANHPHSGFSFFDTYPIKVPFKTLANSDQGRRYLSLKVLFLETFLDMILTQNHVTFQWEHFWNYKILRRHGEGKKYSGDSKHVLKFTLGKSTLKYWSMKSMFQELNILRIGSNLVKLHDSMTCWNYSAFHYAENNRCFRD